MIRELISSFKKNKIKTIIFSTLMSIIIIVGAIFGAINQSSKNKIEDKFPINILKKQILFKTKPSNIKWLSNKIFNIAKSTISLIAILYTISLEIAKNELLRINDMSWIKNE